MCLFLAASITKNKKLAITAIWRKVNSKMLICMSCLSFRIYEQIEMSFGVYIIPMSRLNSMVNFIRDFLSNWQWLNFLINLKLKNYAQKTERKKKKKSIFFLCVYIAIKILKPFLIVKNYWNIALLISILADILKWLLSNDNMRVF